MNKKIDLRIIIVGGGRVGTKTTEFLSNQGHDIIVIEKDPEKCKKISDKYIATVIQGNGSRPSTFIQADPNKADVVAGLTGNSAVNFTVCNFADKINRDIRTVMRVEDSGAKDEFEEYIDSVIYPEGEGGKIAASEIIGGDIRSLSGITGKIEVISVVIGEDSPIANKKLKNVNFPSGSLIISDYDGDKIAKPDSVFEPGERVIVAFESEVTQEVMQLLRG